MARDLRQMTCDTTDSKHTRTHINQFFLLQCDAKVTWDDIIFLFADIGRDNKYLL